MADGSSGLPDWIKTGIRVLIKDKGIEGTVRFVGGTEFAPGVWIGVELDEPKGKNNGSVKGKAYFVCEELYGLMVRSNQLEQVVSADDWVRPGMRVLIKEKNLEGTVRFFDTTEFAPGKWVGVELDEPKGKNNGTVKDKVYFECREKHGLMVRLNQVEPLGEVPRKKLPSSKSAGSPGLKRSQLAKPSGRSERVTTPTSTPLAVSPKMPTKSVKDDDSSQKLAPSHAPPPPSVVLDSDQVNDLQQKITILQQKRTEDKTKIKELEKFRMQYQQMIEYKAKWTESQSELQQQLKQSKKEARDAQLTKEHVEDELRELSDAVEIATLDKEMAEEKCEGLLAENEALKEQIQELSMDLEILQNEISESGYEGAAASGQVKQLEQQNSRLKEALMKLRDVSNQEKSEHQQLTKDFEKQTQVLAHVNEQKDRLEEELKAADEFITTLKEQVDVAMGAEEMVEKLTEQNLQLEEDLAKQVDAVADLEALRDLSEQQEELRIEEEHELREELDLNMNIVRQMERKLEASQETIVDQQQTIGKFRELVKHLQSDLAELRKQPKEGEQEVSQVSTTTSDNVLNQLKSSAVQAYSRTIDYELRKLESQQSIEIINHFKSFMPNSFLVSGGDYDAVNVIMLLPRLIFKSELIIDQLRQQTGIDETLASLQTNPKLDLQTYASFLIYKLTTLQYLANIVIRIINECDVQLYCQLGSIRDDLSVHEKALDILVELLKKEQLDESVPLNGVEKAIHHFESLLQNRLTVTPQCGSMDLFNDQVKVITSACDCCTLELLRLQNVTTESSGFATQLKELATFNNDIRQTCRKARRRLPTSQSGKIIKCPSDLFPSVIASQGLVVSNFRAIFNKVNQRTQSLSESERPSSPELETIFTQITNVIFQGTTTNTESSDNSVVHCCLSKLSKDLEHFLLELQDGSYDCPYNKPKVSAPLTIRAQTVKDELSDTEGLKYKIEEKNEEILELKKNLKLKYQEIGEINTKVGLLEKKLEQAGAECSRKVEEEKMETERIKTVMEQQQEKFNQAIGILQRDIETLEEERDNLKQQLDSQSRLPIPADLSSTRRSMSLSGRQALQTLMSRSSPAHRSQTTPSSASSSSTDVTVPQASSNSPLLLAQIDSLRKALGYSQDENIHLKAMSTKSKLASLPRLNVPKSLPVNKREGKREDNKSDFEKSLGKQTHDLLQDLNTVLGQTCVVDITKKDRKVTSREMLAHQISCLIDLKQRAEKLKEGTSHSVAANYDGGLVHTKLKSFVSTPFSKALSETEPGQQQLLAKLHLPTPAATSDKTCRKLVLSAGQFQALHSLVIT